MGTGDIGESRTAGATPPLRPALPLNRLGSLPISPWGPTHFPTDLQAEETLTPYRAPGLHTLHPAAPVEQTYNVSFDSMSDLGMNLLWQKEESVSSFDYFD